MEGSRCGDIGEAIRQGIGSGARISEDGTETVRREYLDLLHFIIRNAVRLIHNQDERIKELMALAEGVTGVQLDAEGFPPDAPEGNQWKCVDCGHHHKSARQIPGLCEHRVVLADDADFVPQVNP